MRTKRRKYQEKDIIKALNKANRDIEFERNGGGQFVSKTKAHKNKKVYNRKKDKRFDLDLLSFYINNGERYTCLH